MEFTARFLCDSRACCLPWLWRCCVSWPLKNSIFTAHSADYVCLSVRPSYADIVSTPLNMSSKFFTIRSNTILVFSYQTRWQYSDPLTGASNAIFHYLRNDTRYGHRYPAVQIGNLTQAFEWYHFQWSWVTSTLLTKISRSWYYSTSNNSKLVQDRAIRSMADQ